MCFPTIADGKGGYLTRLRVGLWHEATEELSDDHASRVALSELTSLVGQIEVWGGKGSRLVVNCAGVGHWNRTPGPRESEPLCEAVRHAGLTVLFDRCESGVREFFEGVFRKMVAPTGASYNDSVLVLSSPDDWPSIQSKLRGLKALSVVDRQVVRKAVVGCYRPFPDGPELLRSTPLRAPGYFDANFLLGDPEVYPWLVCLLADRLGVILDEWGSGGREFNARLLACTRNGAVLASAIRNVAPLPLDVVDRFSPVHGAIEEYDGGPGYVSAREVPPSYVYVGDFIIGDSDLKMAEAHAYYRKTPLKAAVVIGYVLPPPPVAAAADRSMYGSVRVEGLHDLTKLSIRNLKYALP